MFQGADEALVIAHRFVVTFLLLPRLLLEQLSLHRGVVELSVGITKLTVSDEELESFSEARLGAVVLGEGRH